MTERKAQILIAEDEEADVILLKRVLSKCATHDGIYVVRDGEEALDYLFRRRKFSAESAPSPELVFLDLKLPKMTGLEVLKEVRRDERFRSLPVIIFTSSPDERDRAECLASGASDFLVKPIDFEEFTRVITRTVGVYLPSSCETN